MIDFIKNGSELGAKYGRQGSGQRPHARLRRRAHRRADPSHRRIRAEPVMRHVAVGNQLGARTPRHPHRHHRAWSCLMGSDLPRSSATNLGARLGFLVALAGARRLDDADGHRSGGSTASACKGADPTWQPGPGRDGDPGDRRCCTRPASLDVLPDVPDDATTADEADARRRAARSRRAGTMLESVVARVRSGRRRRPACSSRRRARSPPGEFEVTDVFDIGGESRIPKLGLNDDARLPRVLPQAALRAGRGRAVRAAPHRARPRPDAAADRRDAATPVRLHGPRPRRRCASRRSCITIGRRIDLPRAVLPAAPPRPRSSPENLPAAKALPRAV